MDSDPDPWWCGLRMSHVAVAKFGSRPWIPAEWELHRPRGRGKNKSSVFAFFHHQEKDFLSSLHVRTLIYDMWFLCCCRRGLNTNGEYDTATNLHKTFCMKFVLFFFTSNCFTGRSCECKCECECEYLIYVLYVWLCCSRYWR